MLNQDQATQACSENGFPAIMRTQQPMPMEAASPRRAAASSVPYLAPGCASCSMCNTTT